MKPEILLSSKEIIRNAEVKIMGVLRIMTDHKITEEERELITDNFDAEIKPSIDNYVEIRKILC